MQTNKETNYEFNFDQETKNYCKNQLNETEKSRNKGLADIKQWSEENPQLNINIKNYNLLSFLRACKYDLERTKTKLTNYAQMRRNVPEWFENRNPLLAEIQELVRMGVFLPLKQLHNKQMVVIIRTAIHDPKKHKQNNVFKACNMILDVACFEEELAQIYGVIAILDMKGQSFAHSKELTPTIIKNAVNSWQNYHCRPKRLDFINAPYYINVVLSVFKSFMSEKLKQRMKVHYSGHEALYDIIDKNILPPEYGGAGESITELATYWTQKLCQYSDWFADDEKYKAV